MVVSALMFFIGKSTLGDIKATFFAHWSSPYLLYLKESVSFSISCLLWLRSLYDQTHAGAVVRQLIRGHALGIAFVTSVTSSIFFNEGNSSCNSAKSRSRRLDYSNRCDIWQAPFDSIITGTLVKCLNGRLTLNTISQIHYWVIFKH